MSLSKPVKKQVQKMIMKRKMQEIQVGKTWKQRQKMILKNEQIKIDQSFQYFCQEYRQKNFDERLRKSYTHHRKQKSSEYWRKNHKVNLMMDNELLWDKLMFLKSPQHKLELNQKLRPKIEANKYNKEAGFLLSVEDFKAKPITNFKTCPYDEQMKSDGDKESYIYKCMGNAIINQLDHIQDTSKNRKIKQSLQDYLIKNLSAEAKKYSNNRLNWLQVKTNHTKLKTRLRQNLFETINDTKNKKKFTDSIQECQSLRSKLTKSNTIMDIMQNQRPKKVHLEIDQKNIAVSQSMMSDLLSSKNTLHSNQNKVIPTPKPRSLSQSVMNMTWSNRNEKIFLSHRSQVRKRLCKMTRSISWNEVGIQPFVQKEGKQFRTKQNRQTIFQRFQQKEPVTDEEIRYLANTSSILNTVVDKHFYNQATDLIDRETLENMEMGIVEEILEKYKDTRNNIFQARIAYLSKQNKKDKKKININYNNFMKQKSLKSRQFQQQKLKLKIIKKLNRSMPNFGQKDAVPKVYKKMTIQSFRKQQKRLVGIIKRICPCYKGIPKKNKLSVKHKLHPTTALFVTNVERERNYLNEQQIKDKRKTERKNTEFYKVKIYDPKIRKIKGNHYERYSGGPMREDVGILKRKYSKKERKALNKIYSVLVGHKQRKRAQRLQVEQYEKNKQKRKQARINQKLKDSQKDSNEDVTVNSQTGEKSAFAQVAKENPKIKFKANSKIDDIRQEQIKRVPVSFSLCKQTKMFQSQKLLFQYIKEDNFLQFKQQQFRFKNNEIEIRNVNNDTALYLAVKLSRIEFVKFLLKNHAGANAQCEGRNTPMHVAFRNESIIIVKLLLKAGGKLNILNDKQEYPIDLAKKEMLEQIKDSIRKNNFLMGA